MGGVPRYQDVQSLGIRFNFLSAASQRSAEAYVSVIRGLELRVAAEDGPPNIERFYRSAFLNVARYK